ncbi:PTS sugar transporter subunit IIC [Symbiobacterium thermophilum]|uniref:Permease IIC component n=1 Tax=Symbiobacterium thermophilum (strain DSM 24528 / JCM 14929 / IAM 14863 / T) TaxID=292459 RepID=Q67QV6_SYMTH|nr:PTS transporter subunit EIIC [Symbiobacterium thermophilum]BAD39937.1 PTS system cellobiose-specific IIC component [Symbiobacterium thermophilum IAM 14863]
MSFMQRFMDWMQNSVGPATEKVANNAWISGLQKAILKALPMVLVGSLITIYNVVRNFAPSLPDLRPISTYTFGLISLFMVFCVPYYILELKNVHKTKFVAGFTGIALFFIMLNPTVTDQGYVFNFSGFGAGGMFVAIVAGLFTAAVMLLFRRLTFFKEDSVMPDFVKEWFDSMLPIFVVVFVGWLVVIRWGFDIYSAIVALFTPLMSIAQSLPGMILLYLIPTVFYSMGISGWVFQPILNPVQLFAINANAEAAAAGAVAQYPFTAETTYAFLSLGGRGATLSLVLLLLFAHSKRLKALGRASSVPAVLNINEPVVFGTVAWNPILMIPMWLNGLILPLITYFALKTGLVPIPTEVFTMWYVPIGISSWLVTKSVSGLILTAVNFLVSLAIWFPFFKLYDSQEAAKEAQAAAD